MSAAMMMMMGGQAIQGYMKYESLLDQSESYAQSGAMSLWQGAEIRERADMNKKVFEKETQKLIAQQTGMYAAGGVEVSSGAPLSVMVNTMDTAVERISQMEREAGFSILMKDIEAEAAFRKSGQAREAAMWSLVGTGLGMGGTAMKG